MGRSNRRGKTSGQLVLMIEQLKKTTREQGAPVWRAVAERLEGPSRNWAEVDLGHASETLQEGEVGAVPGKVLADGRPRKGLTLAACSFSKGAREKLAAAGGSALSLPELASANPKGTRVRILG